MGEGEKGDTPGVPKKPQGWNIFGGPQVPRATFENIRIQTKLLKQVGGLTVGLDCLMGSTIAGGQKDR